MCLSDVNLAFHLLPPKVWHTNEASVLLSNFSTIPAARMLVLLLL